MSKRHTDNENTRVKGRKGVELRARRLARDKYLCQPCLKQGKLIPADQVDHIVPLHQGGLDVDENTQSICNECHDAKTDRENAERFISYTHPVWLKPSAVPITIVCGAPASGKTTWVKDRAKAADIVIDLDDIAGRRVQKKDLSDVLRKRNTLLGTLHLRKRGAAYFIVSAPTQAERNWWAGKLNGTVHLLDPGEAVCINRAIERGTPEVISAIKKWYSPNQWWGEELRGAGRKRIGLDGWPE